MFIAIIQVGDWSFLICFRKPMGLEISEIDGGVCFCVKIVPGSSRTSIEGLLGGMLKIKVAAPPEKGKANKELTAFLAKRLNLRKNDIEIMAGHTNPVKTLHIKSINAAELAAVIDECK